jgi:hypothetical protein
VEVPKRLRPTLPTIRRLFAHSGNRCAFPDCDHPLIDTHGNFVAQICHIEAAEVGGERFNIGMTNEERRAPANLMLMCLRHHVETNDTDRFPAERLREIKAAHEARYAEQPPAASDEALDQAVREIAESSIVDWTKRQVLELPSTMDRWFATAYEDHGMPLDQAQREDTIQLLIPTLAALRKLPIDTRSVLSIIIDRGEPYRFDLRVPASEVEHATRTDYEMLHAHLVTLERYGLVNRDEDFDGIVWLVTREIDGWPFWLELKQFCERTGESLDSFLIDLRFDLLD